VKHPKNKMSLLGFAASYIKNTADFILQHLPALNEVLEKSKFIKSLEAESLALEKKKKEEQMKKKKRKKDEKKKEEKAKGQKKVTNKRNEQDRKTKKHETESNKNPVMKKRKREVQQHNQPKRAKQKVTAAVEEHRESDFDDVSYTAVEAIFYQESKPGGEDEAAGTTIGFWQIIQKGGLIVTLFAEITSQMRNIVKPFITYDEGNKIKCSLCTNLVVKGTLKKCLL